MDAYPQPVERKQITLRPAKANALLGLNLSAQEMEDYLGALEVKPVTRKPRIVGSEAPEPDPLTFRIPTFRVDLKREMDLIEEVARLYGVDKIPATPPRGAIGANSYDSVHDQLAEARRILSGPGLQRSAGPNLDVRQRGEVGHHRHPGAAGQSAEQRHERSASEPAARFAGLPCATISAGRA